MTLVASRDTLEYFNPGFQCGRRGERTPALVHTRALNLAPTNNARPQRALTESPTRTYDYAGAVSIATMRTIGDTGVCEESWM